MPFCLLRGWTVVLLVLARLDPEGACASEGALSSLVGSPFAITHYYDHIALRSNRSQVKLLSMAPTPTGIVFLLDVCL